MADSSSSMSARSLRADGATVPRGGDQSHGGRFDDRSGLEDVRQRHVARLKDDRRGARRQPLIGSVDHDATLYPAHHGNETLGLKNAQCLAQRGPRDAEALNELWLVA